MFNELVYIFIQACACIIALALTTIAVRVAANMSKEQIRNESQDSVSKLKSPVTSKVKWTQETPERVRRDHLESFTVKPDLTRAWYDSDQKRYNWADRRNDDVIA
ncbi:unnamed protein product, partial [Brachionus calyciflorus]